jgi:hypothetical protein
MRFDCRARAGAGVLLLAVAIAMTASAAAASVLNVRDEGNLKFITSEGSEIIDQGPATGTVPGKVKVYFTYNGNPQVSARFTIYGSSGTISGKAKGNLNNPNSRRPSFRGKFSVTGGTRRYARIHGTGELFGVFTRRGANKYGLVVQTVGKLTY